MSPSEICDWTDTVVATVPASKPPAKCVIMLSEKYPLFRSRRLKKSYLRETKKDCEKSIGCTSVGVTDAYDAS